MKRFFRSIFSLRFLVRFLFVVVALTTIVALGFAGLVCYLKNSRDIPPPDLSALMPHRTNVPDAENGFLLLEKLNLKLSQEEGEVLANAVVSPNVSFYKWDQPKIDALLTKYHDALAAFDRALALPEFQFPVKTPTLAASNYFTPILISTKLESLLAKDQFRKGNHEAAFVDALKIIDLGKRMENGDGELVHYLVGVTTAQFGNYRIEQFVNQAGTADRSILEECLQKISVPFDETSAFQEAARGDLQYSQKAVYTEIPLTISSGDSWFMKPIYRYKPNETLQLIAKNIQLVIELAPMNFAETKSHLPAKRKGFREWSWSWKRFLSSTNIVGENISGTSIPAYTKILETKYRAQAQHAILQTMLALRLYSLDHNGELPDSLTAIVPHYLPTIPLDDFDGKPIRYSKAHRVIYSVGTKLKDNGGVFSPDDRNNSETPHINLTWK